MARVPLLVLAGLLVAGCQHKDSGSDSSYSDGSAGYSGSSSSMTGSGNPSAQFDYSASGQAPSSLGSQTLQALNATSDTSSISTSALGAAPISSAPIAAAPVRSGSVQSAAQSAPQSAPMNAMSPATITAPKKIASAAPVTTNSAQPRANSGASSGSKSGAGDVAFGSQSTTVNLYAYARGTTNAPGEQIFTRSGEAGAETSRAACMKFSGPSLAQIAFLEHGGPVKDPLGLDPDGDGFACGWDPTPFRK